MNAYLSREEKQSFVRATALVALIEETINGYAAAKSTDPEFLKYLRMGRSMLAKAMTMRGDALGADAKAEFARQVAKLEFICVPRPEAKKAHAEMLAHKTVIPMKVQDFEDWYCAVIETTCKTCTQEVYADCTVRRILTNYGVYPIDPEAKGKCQYGYIGAPGGAELQPSGADTVPAEVYNMAVAELATLQVKMQEVAKNARRYEKERESLNSYSHDLERQCDQWQLKFSELEKQSAACIEIEPQEGELQSVWTEQDRLPVLIGLDNGQTLSLSLSEYMAMNLLFELQNPSAPARAICAKQMEDELIVIDMQQVVMMQVVGLEGGNWQRPAAAAATLGGEQSESERERYRVECKCGAEYFCSMNPGRYKARCRDCNVTVFADRQAEPVPDPVDGAAATLLTNRYWVERDGGSAGRDTGMVDRDPGVSAGTRALPRESYQSKYIGRDKRYAEPCSIFD